MSSRDVIKKFIADCFPTWEKVNFPPNVTFSSSENELYKLGTGEIVLFAYTNVNITGTDRAKPQIRVFLANAQESFAFAKKNNYRFFLFTIFVQDDSMATGLTSFNPRNFIVSLETNLDNETSRRDLRSLYDYVQDNINGRDFIRCPRGAHNAGINQAAFINIGDEQHRIKTVFENYVTFFDNRPYLKTNDLQLQQQSSLAPSNFSPIQTILYGVPGSGKSYSIKHQLSQQEISSEDTVRVVFHPEYTNADFVGQILPKLKNENGENVIDYQFTAGPFTKILRDAYCNPDKNFALIIEEINRGNAAAIFGELFQLLDRLDETETESFNGVTYTRGWSSYGVSNDCINAYLRGLYDDANAEQKIPCIKFDTHSAIRLPANLSLLATMNTSDQNVFSLDNAFKRRWNLKLIPNKFVFDSDDTEENKRQIAQCFAKVEGFDFAWGAFVNAVNEKIITEQSGNDISSFEDKQIGMWFVKAEKQDESYIISKEVFLNKVVEYLFDDVFKLEPATLFTASSLNAILENAQENPSSVFIDSFMTSIQAQQAELENLKGNAKID